MELILQIDYKEIQKVISTNRMYFCGRGGRQIITPEYNKFRSQFSKVIPPIPDALEQFILNSDKSKLRSELHLTWYTDLKFKNGDLARKDASNILKPLEDTLTEWTGLDDKYNMKVSSTKYQRQYNYDTVIAKLRITRLDDDTNNDEEVISIGIIL